MSPFYGFPFLAMEIVLGAVVLCLLENVQNIFQGSFAPWLNPNRRPRPPPYYLDDRRLDEIFVHPQQLKIEDLPASQWRQCDKDLRERQSPPNCRTKNRSGYYRGASGALPSRHRVLGRTH